MYEATEFCSNGELCGVLLSTGGFSIPLSRFYFKQILQAIEEIYNKGYSHRCLQPEHILFDSDFKIKLTGFGFSTPVKKNDEFVLLTEMIGAEGYIAVKFLIIKLIVVLELIYLLPE